MKFGGTHPMWVSISSLPEVFPASLLREPGEVGHIWLRDASCVPPSVLLLLSEQQTVKWESKKKKSSISVSLPNRYPTLVLAWQNKNKVMHHEESTMTTAAVTPEVSNRSSFKSCCGPAFADQVVTFFIWIAQWGPKCNQRSTNAD